MWKGFTGGNFYWILLRNGNKSLLPVILYIIIPIVQGWGVCSLVNRGPLLEPRCPCCHHHWLFWDSSPQLAACILIVKPWPLPKWQQSINITLVQLIFNEVKSRIGFLFLSDMTKLILKMATLKQTDRQTCLVRILGSAVRLLRYELKVSSTPTVNARLTQNTHRTAARQRDLSMSRSCVRHLTLDHTVPCHHQCLLTVSTVLPGKC